MKILVIDGFYFARRCLAILNMKDECLLNTESEKESFIRMLNSNFVNTWEKLSHYCDNILVATDYESWRKELKPVIPYYINEKQLSPDMSEVKYKGQREAQRNESPINFNNFYAITSKYFDDMKNYINTIKIKGFEGDDIIALLSEKALVDKDLEFLLIGTDKDTAQNVNDKFIYFRNIKSKASPYGEFMMCKSAYDKIFNSYHKNIITDMISFDIDKSYDKLLSLNLVDDTVVNRSLERGVTIVKPYQIIFEKAIIGDESDNILPLFRWFNAPRKYSVTENKLKKAMEMSCLSYSEKELERLTNINTELTDEIYDLLYNLSSVCSQKTDIKKVFEHYKHNLKLVTLKSSIMPQELVNNFNVLYENIKTVIMKNRFDLLTFKQNNKYENVQNSNNILEQSVPGLEYIGDLMKIL